MAKQLKCKNLANGDIYKSKADASRKLGVSEHTVNSLVQVIGVSKRVPRNPNFMLADLSSDKSRRETSKTEEAKRKLEARRAVEDLQDKRKSAADEWFEFMETF